MTAVLFAIGEWCESRTRGRTLTSHDINRLFYYFPRRATAAVIVSRKPQQPHNTSVNKNVSVSPGHPSAWCMTRTRTRRRKNSEFPGHHARTFSSADIYLTYNTATVAYALLISSSRPYIIIILYNNPVVYECAYASRKTNTHNK